MASRKPLQREERAAQRPDVPDDSRWRIPNTKVGIDTVHLVPGYVDRVLSHDGLLLVRVAGVPVSEWLFGASFGAYWSGLYEHWQWTFR